MNKYTFYSVCVICSVVIFGLTTNGCNKDTELSQKKDGPVVVVSETKVITVSSTAKLSNGAYLAHTDEGDFGLSCPIPYLNLPLKAEIQNGVITKVE